MPRQFVRQATARPARGFTLIELMIVLVIIGVLMTIVTLNFVGATTKAKTTSTMASMKTIQGALDMYRGQYSAYPPTSMGLQALVTDGILKASNLKDSWGHDFGYVSPTIAHPYELRSKGDDGVAETADDIIVFPEQ